MVTVKFLYFIFVVFIFSGSNCHRLKRIVNGTSPTRGEFPFMVYVKSSTFSNENSRCGGVLISLRHVLTAAHCVHDRKTNEYLPKILVKVCTADLIGPVKGKKVIVDRVKIHPNFTVNVFNGRISSVHDIAIIRLYESITASEFVKPISLPNPMQEYPKGTQFIVNGFSNASLKKLTTYAVSQEVCQKYWPHRIITPGHLCTLATLGSGTCYGDSGSPLTIDGQVLVGIATEGSDNGCGTDVPDISTKVSHYLDFIKNEMERTD